MAAKQSKLWATRKSPKAGRSVDSRARRRAATKAKADRFNMGRFGVQLLLPLILYNEMHDVLTLLALLIVKHNIKKAQQNAYDVTREFQRGEFPIAKTLLQKPAYFFARTKRHYNCLIRSHSISRKPRQIQTRKLPNFLCDHAFIQVTTRQI